MTIAHIGSRTVQGANGGTSSSLDTTGGNFVVVSVGANLVDGTLTISDNKSNTYTPLTARDGQDPKGRMYYCANATCGTGHTFTCGGTSVFVAASFAVFSGVKVSSPFGAEINNSSVAFDNTNTLPGSLVPSEDGMLVVGGFANNGGSAVTSITAMTLMQSVVVSPGVGQGVAQGYAIQTTATSINPQFNGMGGSAGNCSQATFKAEPVSAVRRRTGVTVIA